jgi:hypothetical protein
MRYGDLIQFEPIESVIQLLDAGRPDEAKKLVATYVISDDMAERIAKLMDPQLSFRRLGRSQGRAVVGNYGTGKSHLMSVLSLVAEDAAYAPDDPPPQGRRGARPIAGKFKVHCASRSRAADVAAGDHHLQLERFLEKIGVDYTFPPADKELNNKEPSRR